MSDDLMGPGNDGTGRSTVPAQHIQQLLERFAEESRETSIRMARVWIHRPKIDEVGFAPEGAYAAA